MAVPNVHLVSTMKNEGPYLLEWIAYHRAIGVTGFTLFSNDCTDGTNLMLNRLDTMGVVRHFDNPLNEGMDPQRRAYARANHMEAVRQADWVLIVDADEFLNIHVGDRTVAALIDACGTPDAISVPWRLMGSGGHARMEDRLVTERFTRAASTEKPEHGVCYGFKTLFRPQVFDYFGVHRPRFDSKKRETFPQIPWTNASGEQMPDSYLEKGWRFGKENCGRKFAQVNHYAVKSREEFLLKRLRGTANSKDKDRIDTAYFPKFDLNTCEDKTIPAHLIPPVLDEMLADSDLAALRRACLDSCARTLDYQREDPILRAFVETGAFPNQKAA